MFLIRDISLFLWLLLAFCAAHYAAVNLDIPYLDMNYILYVHDKTFFITTRDAFTIVGVLFLFVEIYKAATTGEYSTSETIVSFFVAVAYLALFLIMECAHNAEFFILMMMSFLDAIGGFVISINAARKDIAVKK
jgi:hypothetical protein